jgi:hypothetical protein
MFLIDFTILLLLILIFEYYKSYGNQCGIPLVLWIEIFFIILLTKSFFNLNIIWISRFYYSWRVPFLIVSWVLFTGALVGWIIYGYVLYFSDSNDCQKHSDTSFWLVVMIVILFIGLFIMLVFFIAICCGPFLYCYIRN